MSELKPCPFCGHTPEMITDYGVSVQCPNCAAHTVPSYDENKQKNVAITAWNNDFIYFSHEEIPYRLFKALDRIASEAGNSK